MKEYCTQNDGNCPNCSLVNYGLDCKNIPLTGKYPDMNAQEILDAIREAITDSLRQINPIDFLKSTDFFGIKPNIPIYIARLANRLLVASVAMNERK